MNQPKPALISEELLDRLNVIATAETIDLNAVSQVEFRARSLLKLRAASYYCVMGACACIRGDKEKVIEYFDEAVRLEPGAEALDNYSLSLQYLGEYHLLVEQARKFVKQFPTNLSVLMTAWSWFREYASIPDLVETERLMNIINGNSEMVYETDKTAAALSARNLTHEDLSNVLFAARNFLRDKGLFHAVSNNYYSASEDEPLIAIRYIFKRDPDELFEMEVELMKSLIDLRLPAYEANAVCVYLANQSDRVVLDADHAH